LIQSIHDAYPTIANDGRSILIGITESDIDTTSENWLFALGLRGPRMAVVSSARMDLPCGLRITMKFAPPGRTSISATSVVYGNGVNHCMRSSGSAQARYANEKTNRPPLDFL